MRASVTDFTVAAGHRALLRNSDTPRRIQPEWIAQAARPTFGQRRGRSAGRAYRSLGTGTSIARQPHIRLVGPLTSPSEVLGVAVSARVALHPAENRGERRHLNRDNRTTPPENRLLRRRAEANATVPLHQRFFTRRRPAGAENTARRMSDCPGRKQWRLRSNNSKPFFYDDTLAGQNCGRAKPDRSAGNKDALHC